MINFKQASSCENDLFSVQKNVNKLYKSIQDAECDKKKYSNVFIWSGFGEQISSGFFEKKDWQNNFIGLFSNQEMWPWKFKVSLKDEDKTGNSELIRILESSLKRNIIASLTIRNFNSKSLFKGSPEWLEEITPFLNTEYIESKLLIDHIVKSLYSAKKVGINLFLEKISLIVNNNPKEPITLTPHLHRDGAYGYLESGAVSFYSERITPNSSTLFFPNFDFESASQLKPITADKLNSLHFNTDAYSLASGSLALFSGKMGDDGTKSDKRGALHISPEGFFPTCRLLFLFRSKII